MILYKITYKTGPISFLIPLLTLLYCEYCVLNHSLNLYEFPFRRKLENKIYFNASTTHFAINKADELISFVNDDNFIGNITNVTYSTSGDQCIIFASEEGDPDNCWCPAGYVMCTWQDVEDVRKKQQQSKWLKQLCKSEEDGGFNNTSIYIDYELSIQCKYTDDGSFSFKYFVTPFGDSISIDRLSRSQHTVARRCMSFSFYLCKPVANTDVVDCQITEWSKWSTYCINNIQRRYRTILKAGEHGGKQCLWNKETPQYYAIEELRECPDYFDDEFKLWTSEEKKNGKIMLLSK